MAETLKINIEVAQSGGGGDGEKVGVKNKDAKDNAKAFWTFDRAKNVVKQFGSQIVNGHVGMIGFRTGNYVVQERVQRGLNVAQRVVGIGVSFALNPYLGLLNLASEGISLAFDYSQKMLEIQWQNREAAELARRAGYLADNNRNG